MKLLKGFLILLASFVVLSCAENREEDSRRYYRDQVKLRMEQLVSDTSYRELPAVHQEIEKIILVSKDSENPQAAVNLARTLFQSLSQTYGLERTDFPDIEPGMSTEEVELRLRENELAFFDRLVLKADTGMTKLFTAH